MKKMLLVLVLIISTITYTYAQAGMCADSDPFFTSNVYTFPAGVEQVRNKTAQLTNALVPY
ncbi:MAG: hypothetical protein A2W85_00980 [Bacteroidetes bacterium GWF2_41_31]|nr:MAG: hypothetical protein A2W85_00980 [Bacteroidetes bacterium GWF2_41_31]